MRKDLAGEERENGNEIVNVMPISSALIVLESVLCCAIIKIKPLFETNVIFRRTVMLAKRLTCSRSIGKKVLNSIQQLRHCSIDDISLQAVWHQLKCTS